MARVRESYALHAAAFDGLAADYDADFTATPLGGLLRALVWSRLDCILAADARVLDLGCGTGEDAVRLASRGARVVALDASPAMVRVAAAKAAQRGCSERTEFHCAPAERLGEVLGDAVFDGVISNFGALNCVADLPALAREVAARVRPGGRLVWVLMGRHVPWEWAWYLLRADARRAARRLSGRTRWRGLEIHYPTPSAVSAALRPSFRVDALRPLGFALPPSYAAAWLNRHPRLLSALARLEHLGRRSALLAWVADHYIVEATRLPADGAAA